MNREEILQLANDCALIGNVGTDAAVLRFAERLLEIGEKAEKPRHVLTGDPAPDGCVAVEWTTCISCAAVALDKCQPIKEFSCVSGYTKSGKSIMFVRKEEVK